MQEIFFEIVVLFLLSIVVTLVCNRLKLPATVGFLLTGAIFGPNACSLVSDQHAVSEIAELGVAMLMFTIGMELSGEALNRLKRPVFLGGTLQIGLTILAVLLWMLTMEYTSWQEGILWGCLVALSSSAIVLQLIQKRGESETPYGRLSLAILVFQDIMAAPMLICVPLLAGAVNLSWQSALFSTGKIVLILGAVLIAARLWLGRIMEAVLKTRAREVLLMTTLGLCMGMATLTNWLGLSLSLGAFLAGLLLARSPYSMSVISGILPYKDVFISLFFISVGMLLDIRFLFGHLGEILTSTVIFIIFKSIVTLPSVLIQGYPIKVAVLTSLSLAQVGEFAFVIADKGLKMNLFTENDHQIFLAVSVITMMLTPALIALAPKIAAKIPGRKEQRESESAGEAHSKMEGHLIIIGFGISGKHLAFAAKKSGIQYQILEMNPETVSQYRGREPIMHGDASAPVVLEHLGIDKARVMAIVISDPSAVRLITEEAHKMNPNLHIVARTRFVTEIAPLRHAGASVVISEEFESSIEVFSSVLTQYLVPRQDIDVVASHIRERNYRMLRRATSHAGTMEGLVSRLPDMNIQALRLEADSPLCGLSLAQSQLRAKYGVNVVGIQRGEEFTASFDPSFTFSAGDVVYIFAQTAKLFAVTPVFSGAPSEPQRTAA
ncbi:MAG: cation:proton antiporter [Desulfovibrio sp.]|nr:cation:proton antiporter [Desulfovibrio sp.]